MKLTIIRLTTLSEQDRIDLAKIWPGYDADAFLSAGTQRLYAARFNERLLAAARVSFSGDDAGLSAFCVREITRRRGVGLYLLEEILRDNPGIRRWRMADSDLDDKMAMDAFMQAAGFTTAECGWEK